MTNDAKPSGQANDLMPFTPDEMVQTPEQRATFEEAYSLTSSSPKISTVTPAVPADRGVDRPNGSVT